MKKINELENFDWIKNDLWVLGKRPDGLEGHTIRHCLPPLFSSYFKLLHPIFLDTTIEDLTITWDEVRNDHFKEEDLKQIYWKDLANEFNLSFIPEISWWSFYYKAFKRRSPPRYLIGPYEGSLENPALGILEKILTEYTANDEDIFFCYNFLATTNWEGKNPWVLYKGYLKEINDFKNLLDEVRLSPTYWWPESKKWCVCTDYDLDFTLIGGSQDLIRKLSNTHDIEGFVVKENTRIDAKADERNI
jgi:hypothetical protein